MAAAICGLAALSQDARRSTSSRSAILPMSLPPRRPGIECTCRKRTVWHATGGKKQNSWCPPPPARACLMARETSGRCSPTLGTPDHRNGECTPWLFPHPALNLKDGGKDRTPLLSCHPHLLVQGCWGGFCLGWSLWKFLYSPSPPSLPVYACD